MDREKDGRVIQGKRPLNKYLTFILDTQAYGIDIYNVMSIQKFENVQSLPNTLDYCLGIIYLNEVAVPIVDLRGMFKLDKPAPGIEKVIIFLNFYQGYKDKMVGFVVDAVLEVHTLNDEHIYSLPIFGKAIDVQYVTGLASMAEDMIILLNVEHMIEQGLLDDVIVVPDTGEAI